MTTQPVGKHHEFGLADRLRAAREGAGYDQRGFEVATGLSRGTISNYERGLTAPRRPQLVAWSLATGYDLEWLRTGKTPRSDGPEGLEELPHLDSNQEPSD